MPFEMTRTFAQWWPSAPVPGQSKKMNPRKVDPELVFDFKLLPRRTTQAHLHKISPGYSDIHLPNQLARGYGFVPRKVMDFGFLSLGSLGRNGKAIFSPSAQQLSRLSANL